MRLRLGLDRWPVLIAAVALVMTVTAAAVGLAMHWQENARDTKAAMQREARSTVKKDAQLPPEIVNRKDFTDALPEHIDPSLVLLELERSSAAAGVALRGVQTHKREATGQQLGLVTLTIHLQGNYPSMKQVLIDLQSRHSFITVQTLSFRGGANSVAGRIDECWLSLSLWSRVLPADAAASTAKSSMTGA